MPTTSNPIDFDARILNSLSYTTGLVELYYQSKWLPICDSNWNKEEGLVFCKQLSFPSLLNTFLSNAYGGSQVNQALMGITCTGSESSITECDMTNFEIISNADCTNAAIVCSGTYINFNHKELMYLPYVKVYYDDIFL